MFCAGKRRRKAFFGSGGDEGSAGIPALFIPPPGEMGVEMYGTN